MKLTFLGTGTSQGVPMIGCGCEVCRSKDPRDKRLRSSVLVEWDGMNILVDAGPDFRYQMLRVGVTHLDAILLTHNHKDHTGGLDDIRAFNYIEKRPAEIYCEKYVEESLRQEYSYAFAEKKYPGAPEWHIHNIDERPFTIRANGHPALDAGSHHAEQSIMANGEIPGQARDDRERRDEQKAMDDRKELTIIPIRGRHFTLPVLGYRFGDIAYCTDMNHIDDKEFEKLKDLKHFIINCVRRGRHISHFSLEGAVEVAKRVGAEHTWLTHLSHRLPTYVELSTELLAARNATLGTDHPFSTVILPAYDGLVIE